MKYLDADIIAMGLVFKQFNLAVPYRFGKEETLPLVAIYGTIIFGNTFLEGQIHEKRKQTTTIYTFILLKSFFSSRHKIIPVRLIVDLKFTLLGDASIDHQLMFMNFTLPIRGLNSSYNGP